MSYKFSSHGIEVEFNDNSKEMLDALRNAVERGLAEIGETAVTYAKKSLTEQKAVDTGRLRNSINCLVQDDEVYIGTNVEYAIYVELGTGKYTEGGRPGWWVYVEGNERKGSSGKRKGSSSNMKIYTKEEAARVVAILRSKGLDAHMTEGREAQPFLAPAAKNHTQEYRDMLKDSLENA